MDLKLFGEILAGVGTIIAITNYCLVSRGKILGTGKIFNMNVLIACIFFLGYGLTMKAIMGTAVPGVYITLSSIKLYKDSKKEKSKK